jgi:hypothetical protein
MCFQNLSGDSKGIWKVNLDLYVNQTGHVPKLSEKNVCLQYRILPKSVPFCAVLREDR